MHRSRKTIQRAQALFYALLAVATGASAHHSFAMYDSQKLLTVSGTVRTFQWTNPHVILWLVSGPAAGGEAELWTFELPTSPGVLTRMGWTKHSLEPGDRVTVQYNPLRSGERGGSFKKATLIDSGTVLEINPGPAATKPDATVSTIPQQPASPPQPTNQPQSTNPSQPANP